MTSGHCQRIAIFSRYCLADQYDLAAEFCQMLHILARHSKVLHLSLRGDRPPPSIPPETQVVELPLSISRTNPKDIFVKTCLLYALLPLVAVRLRMFRPDLVFITETLPLFGAALKLLAGARVATAYGDWHLHNFLGRKKWARPLLRLAECIDRFEVRRLDGFFCRAGSAAERLRMWGVDKELIRVVHDAPDPTAFFPRPADSLRQQCGFNPDDIVLCYHGVMHQGKGLDRLLEWIADLLREGHKLKLVLIGDGPERQRLQMRASALGIDKHVMFTGWLRTIKEVGDYCNAADICVVMRTATEANDRVVPGALLHCMACRKVVIAPRLSGVAEVITDGVNGFLFAPANGEDFKQLMRRLLASRSQWERVAEQAYRDVQQHYSVDATAAKYASAIMHFAQYKRLGGGGL
ncbi:MAG: hypothetical protein DRP22_04595 [Verrucomicrobia bacterium]|nr:MAG: hypothetical protein DRP22_04595 [Verrucomicrobiota bacterium]